MAYQNSGDHEILDRQKVSGVSPRLARKGYSSARYPLLDIRHAGGSDPRAEMLYECYLGDPIRITEDGPHSMPGMHNESNTPTSK
jgi:hypothetical protein